MPLNGLNAAFDSKYSKHRQYDQVSHVTGQLLQSTVDHMNHKDIITCLEVCEDGMAFVTV